MGLCSFPDYNPADPLAGQEVRLRHPQDGRDFGFGNSDFTQSLLFHLWCLPGYVK